MSNPRRTNTGADFGTDEVVEALVAAARVVATDLPGGTVVINDLSLEHGGVIDHHGSHQAGRDVDVLFYLLDLQGRPRPSLGVPIDPAGEGTDYRDLLDPEDDVPVRLDVPRTFRFIQALLESEFALVQRIFVVEHVRSLLLAEGHRVGAPRAVLDRLADVTCQPAYAHDDHLHVRFFCTDEDLRDGCADSPPVYPWRRDQLAAIGLSPVLEVRERRRRGRVVTEAEARANAPAMHPSVRAFLDRRDTWITQPHPGRPYCR